MKIKAGEFQIHISTLVFILPPVMFAAGCLKEYAIAFLSIVLHEMGHLAVARHYGCKLGPIRVLPVGLSVSIQDGNCSGKASILLYSAGPLVNIGLLLAAAIFAAVFPGGGVFFQLFAATNAYLALFNLIPAVPLDGGRIFLELLSGRMGLLAAGRLSRRLALLLALLISAAGVLQARSSVFNFSLIIIGLYLVVLWKNSKMESALMNIRQIIYRRTKLLKRGIYPARDLVVIKSTRLDETLKCMDFDRFHLVYLLDEELRLLRVFTENEIMDAVSLGDGITFGQLLERREGGASCAAEAERAP